MIIGSGYARLELSSNQLKRFESGVFQSVLLSLKGNNNDYNSYYASINGGIHLEVSFNQSEVDIINMYRSSLITDPIDCTTDPCHLAWLIRDNRQLINYVRYGYCSNGTAFSDLNAFGYSNCPISC